jgi:hypothetical protein
MKSAALLFAVAVFLTFTIVRAQGRPAKVADVAPVARP